MRTRRNNTNGTTGWRMVRLGFAALAVIGATLLLAYLGGRAGEVLESRKDDLVEVSESWKDDPVEAIEKLADFELQFFRKTGHQDWTCKFDVKKTNSLISPLAGQIAFYDGAGDCVREWSYSWNEKLAFWTQSSDIAPKHDAAMREHELLMLRMRQRMLERSR